MKLITELNIGDYENGGEVEEPVNPELPDRGQLYVGNHIAFANKSWIVVHITSNEAYLTLEDMSGSSNWHNLQNACNAFANQMTEEQKSYLKNIVADTTSGKVFVATYDQMEEGFEYFYTAERRKASTTYWTSTKYRSNAAYWVNMGGYLSTDSVLSASLGFRPSICIDLAVYNA